MDKRVKALSPTVVGKTIHATWKPVTPHHLRSETGVIMIIYSQE